MNEVNYKTTLIENGISKKDNQMNKEVNHAKNMNNEFLKMQNFDRKNLLADTCLQLLTKHFATETIIQIIVTNFYEALKDCQNAFICRLSQDNSISCHIESLKKIFVIHLKVSLMHST